jgi:MYXO-CTERM domain-containing protein
LARQAPLASLDETERVLSATASAVAGQSAPLLAQEIFPAPAPLQMALGGVSVSGRSSDSEGGIGGGFEGGFAAWGGGGYGGLAPWQSVAAQVPGGQIPVPRIPDQSLPQTVPVVWVASSETAFLTPGLITSASTVPAGESALPTSPPAPASSSFLSAVPSGGGGSVMAPPELPASTSGSGTETPSGGGGDSGPPLTGDSPTTPPVSDTPTDTPEPGTGLLAAAGALAVAGLAAFRRRRQRAS